MSDVEENNFEGRVSTKPREPSSATARCSGFHRGDAVAGSCAGVRARGAASGAVAVASSPPKMASGFHSCPKHHGQSRTPFFGGRPTETREPPGPMCPRSAPSVLATPRGAGPRGGGAAPAGRPDSVVGASRGGLSGDPEHRRGPRGRRCAGLPSGRGPPRAGACVSLALCCSGRPRLCWDRRRCVSKGESLEVEGGTSPRKWLVNDRNDP